MKKVLLIAIGIGLFPMLVQAQKVEGNPFARLGYQVDVFTFGKDKEFHDQDVVVEIGDILYNTQKKEVVGFVVGGDTLIELRPELQSMSIDPHAEKYYSITPYAYCMNNPVNCIDPDGKDWYKVQNDKGEWEYKFNDQIHSQEALNEIVKSGMYLGRTYTENNVYYSLFGSQMEANSFEGGLYQKIDNAIISRANYIDELKRSKGGEDIKPASIDFTIEGKHVSDSKYLGIDSHRNEFPISYEGSYEGIYYANEGKNGNMRGTITDWIGDSDMPKHVGGWQSGQKAYHIRFQNNKRADIIHLKYDVVQTNRIIKIYNNLFGRTK